MLPYLFQSQAFTLYTYPLVMGIAWGLSYNLVTDKLSSLGQSKKDVNILFWGTFAFAWLGSKVFYLIYSSGDMLHQHSTSSNFWLGGGFVFYGGLVFGLCFALNYIFFFKKISFAKAAEVIPILPLCHGIGRLGCLAAGCCFGEETHSALSIEVDGVLRHPVQLYESISLLLLSGLLFKFQNQKIDRLKLFNTYIFGYGVIRFSLEFIRGDMVRGIGPFGLSTSQMVALCFCIVAVILQVLSFIKLKKR